MAITSVGISSFGFDKIFFSPVGMTTINHLCFLELNRSISARRLCSIVTSAGLSASVRRESLRRFSSAIQLLTVLTISRSLCRSVFAERSTGKVFDLLFLPRFRTLTPEFITSSRSYSRSLNQPERLCNPPATPFVRIRRLSLWLVAQIWKGHASERDRAL